MLRRALAAVIAVLMFGCGGCRAFASDDVPKTPADLEIVAKMETAKSLIPIGYFQVIVSELQPIADGELYPRLSVGYRHDLDSMLGYAAFRLRRLPLAHAALVRASQSPLATNEDWSWRMHVAKLGNDFADAFVAFKILRDRAPGFEKTLDDRSVSVLDQGFGRLPDAGAQAEWEGYLQASGWRPMNPMFSPDVIRLHYVLSLLDSGRKDEAAVIAETFSEPIVLSVMTADHRFDGITGKNPARFDAAEAVQRRLAQFRREALDQPQSLSLQSGIASELYALGRSDEALTIVRKALIMAQQASTEDRMSNPDIAGDYDHALVQESFILFSLGRRDEALGVAAGIGGCRPCGPNTSTALLQARWLVALGRGQEALEHLAPISPADLTLPASMTLAQLKVCASELAGDSTGRSAGMQYLRAHAGDAPTSYIRAQLCMGDVAEAAAYVRASLSDLRLRHLVLAELQVYLPDGAPTPTEALMAARLERLREDPDVRAAVEKVGRIQRQSIRQSDIY